MEKKNSHCEIICDDILHWCEMYSGPPFHSILCDPPYEIGFMNKAFDKTGVSFHSETWVALSKHLLPGAFIMVFGGSRTHHRLACAIEDAGFTIHPTIVWLTAQGFPKATRIDTQINSERRVIGETIQSYPKSTNDVGASSYGISGGHLKEGRTAERIHLPITEPTDEFAKVWTGHRYGLQALKPAAEMIIVAQKPYDKRPVESITETGAGALWIDGGRIPTGSEIVTAGHADSLRRGTYHEHDGWDRPWKQGERGREDYAQRREAALERTNTLGRWPANLVLSHTPECKLIGTKKVKGSRIDKPCTEHNYTSGFGNTGDRPARGIGNEDGLEGVEEWQCAEGCPIKVLGEQSGISTSTGGRAGHTAAYHGGYKQEYYGDTKPGLGDTGNASRFFFNADWSYEIAEQIEQATPFFYQSKASRSERDTGLEQLPESQKVYMRTSSGKISANMERFASKMHNSHPTVKSISLCKHLATLLLPPAAYAPRRILVPFAGSGSECIAAILTGFEYVLGIEMDEGYCNIARARLSWWTSRMQETNSSDPSTILKKKPSKKQPIGNQSEGSTVQPNLL